MILFLRKVKWAISQPLSFFLGTQAVAFYQTFSGWERKTLEALESLT